MELTLDIFKNDAFAVTSLQRVVDKAPYQPSALGAMRLFEPKPILTREVIIYEKDGGYAMIGFSELGGPDDEQIRRAGRMRVLPTKRLSKRDTVRGGELSAVADTALPETIRLRSATDLVNSRTTQLKTDMEATKEFLRLKAIQGLVVNPKTGVTELNLFTQYGISPPATVDFDKSDLAGAGKLPIYIEQNIVNPMMDALEGRRTPQTKIGALVGDNFWYWLISHPDVVDRWKAQELAAQIALAANPLLQGIPRYSSIEVGKVTFMHYHGSTSGDIEVGDDDAHFFPIGAKDVFCVYWAPGETILDAGQIGRPEYLYIQPDPNDRMPEWVKIVLRAYPLYACIFPGALLNGELSE